MLCKPSGTTSSSFVRSEQSQFVAVSRIPRRLFLLATHCRIFFFVFLINMPGAAAADCWWAAPFANPYWYGDLPNTTYASAQEALDAAASQHLHICTLSANPTLFDVIYYSSPPDEIWYIDNRIHGSVPILDYRYLLVQNPNGEGCVSASIQAINISYIWWAPTVRAEFPQCAPSSYTVELSRPDGGSVDEAILDKIEPGSIGGPSTVDTALLVAKVYDQNNQVIPNVGIQLKVDVISSSGGHNHDDTDRHQNYAGTLSFAGIPSGTVTDNGRTITGNTGTSGLFFRFTSPAYPNNPAGDHQIIATCTDRTCMQEGPQLVWVAIKDLTEVPYSSVGLWNLIGSTLSHPSNHFLTADASQKLVDLAANYHAMFPTNPPLQLNDASLERGGLFDLYPNSPAWQPPHAEHRRGVVIDIQANGTAGAIPERNFDDFRALMRSMNMNWLEETLNQSNGHFHVRLLGTAQ